MSRQEVINRNVLTTLLLERGYNVFLPVIDAGIDFVAHRESDNDLRLVQQKGRWGIWRKYTGRGIHIAFPFDGTWYLIPHDEMLDWPEVARFMGTASWCDKGEYHSGRLSVALQEACRPFRLSPATGLTSPPRPE